MQLFTNRPYQHGPSLMVSEFASGPQKAHGALLFTTLSVVAKHWPLCMRRECF